MAKPEPSDGFRADPIQIEQILFFEKWMRGGADFFFWTMDMERLWYLTAPLRPAPIYKITFLPL